MLYTSLLQTFPFNTVVRVKKHKRFGMEPSGKSIYLAHEVLVFIHSMKKEEKRRKEKKRRGQERKREEGKRKEEGRK